MSSPVKSTAIGPRLFIVIALLNLLLLGLELGFNILGVLLWPN